MMDKMDYVRDRFYEEHSIQKEQEMWQGVEKIPKFEGIGRRSPGPRSSRNIKLF
jgi:hypothetical protein